MKLKVTVIAILSVATAVGAAAMLPDRDEPAPSRQEAPAQPVAASALATGFGNSADGRTVAAITVVGPDGTGGVCMVVTIVRANETGRQEMRSVFVKTPPTSNIDEVMSDDGGGRAACRIVAAMPEGGWAAARGKFEVSVTDP